MYNIEFMLQFAFLASEFYPYQTFPKMFYGNIACYLRAPFFNVFMLKTTYAIKMRSEITDTKIPV